MIYSIAIENTFNSNLTKKIVDLSTISPSTITDPTIPYIEYVSDQKERLNGYVYLPLYKRNQFCIIPPNSILTIETENSDEAIFYVSQKLEFSKITSNPDPITGIVTSLLSSSSSISDITKDTVVDLIGREMADIIIPNDINKIGYGSFARCTNITSVIIPDNIISIEDFAFDGCTNLADITIPSSVESITGRNVFTGCTKLTNIYIDKESGSLSGSPWGATNATITWK